MITYLMNSMDIKNPKKDVQESRVPYFCTGHKRHGRKQVLILYGMVGLVNTFRKA